MDTIIETVGYTVKEEKLMNSKLPHLENTMVLEPSKEYSNDRKAFLFNSPDLKPSSIFFITKSLLPYPEMKRMVRKVQKELDFYFQATVGTIHLDARILSSLVVYGLEKESQVLAIQEAFKDKGVIFHSDDYINDSVSFVRNFKQMLLYEVENGIFYDSIYPDRYFIEIPHEIDFHGDHIYDMFDKSVLHIKSILNNIQFEAAFTKMFVHGTLRTYARVFSKNNTKSLSFDDLRNIRRAFYSVTQFLNIKDN